MKNPWGLEGKNPWKKDKKEPSVEKKSNPWGLTGKKPWGKEETDKERIARLEKEVEDLKDNQKEHDDSWIDEQSFVSKPKKKKSGMGCLFWFALIALVFYLFIEKDKGKQTDKMNNSSSTGFTQKSEGVGSNNKFKEEENIGDRKKYTICYGQMTEVHKQTGMHENNREGSIKAKETICGAYSRGEIDDYPKPN